MLGGPGVPVQGRRIESLLPQSSAFIAPFVPNTPKWINELRLMGAHATWPMECMRKWLG